MCIYLVLHNYAQLSMGLLIQRHQVLALRTWFIIYGSPSPRSPSFFGLQRSRHLIISHFLSSPTPNKEIFFVWIWFFWEPSLEQLKQKTNKGGWLVALTWEGWFDLEGLKLRKSKKRVVFWDMKGGIPMICFMERYQSRVCQGIWSEYASRKTQNSSDVSLYY